MSSETSQSRRRTLVATAIACEGGLALLALSLGLLLRRPPAAQFPAEFADAARQIGLGLIACVPLLAALVLMNRYPWGPLKSLQNLMRHWVAPLFAECSYSELLLISVMAGVGEELFFRGLIQEAVQQGFGPFIALAAASLLFGLAHPMTVAYVVVATVVGAYLGWLWLSGGGLLAPIVTHATYDFAALVYVIRQSGVKRE